MRTSTLIILAALSAGPLLAQSAKQVADNLKMPELQAGATEFPVPTAPHAEVKILGADYEQIISENGKISPVLSATPVNISFSVTKDGKKAISKDYQLIIKPADAQTDGLNPKPQTIPAILEWKGGKGMLTPAHITLESSGKLTSLPMKEIQAELNATLKASSSSVDTIVKLNLVKRSPYNLGEEGYELKISHNGVSITACSEQALYWGTRTLAQILTVNAGQLPCGKAVDFPRYALRGFMLDVGRVPVPMSFLYEVVRTMAWYKMNDLHLHLNDNYIFHENYVDAGKDPFTESYDGFRLESDVKGKNGDTLHSQDLYYTKREFARLIQFAKARGVNIVPEFDTPGHALSFTRIRPDLIYQGKMDNPKRRCEMLDAANPETLKFVGSVWDEYLKPNKKLGQAVFEGCVVHVGADEFYGEKEDYRKYMDGIIKFVQSRGYTPRVWGSLNKKPGKTPITAKGVQLNLWNSGWARAWDSIEQGFDIINTNDQALYIVPFANYYRADKRYQNTYRNWKPNVIGSETIPAGHPRLLGAAFAIWNDMTDMKYNGYTPYDTWSMFSTSADILSQKMWGTAANPRDYAQHRKLVGDLGFAPNTNPYALPAWSSYRYDKKTTKPTVLGKGSIGPNYHLTMDLMLKEAKEGKEQVLLKSDAGEFIAVMKDGSVGFRREDTIEFSFGYKLPIGKKVTLELIGKAGSTELLVDGQKVGTLAIKTLNEGRTDNLHATFILPLQLLSPSFKGEVYKLSVRHEVPQAIKDQAPKPDQEAAPTNGDSVATPGAV